LTLETVSIVELLLLLLLLPRYRKLLLDEEKFVSVDRLLSESTIPTIGRDEKLFGIEFK
jgi:hypothetical protein